MDQAIDRNTPQAAQGCLEALSRCTALVELLSTEQFNAHQGDNDSIGQHLRHCLEHFLMFFQGLDTGLVDYDARPREQALALSRDLYLQREAGVMDLLRSLRDSDLSRPLRLRFLPCPGAESIEIDTSVARELNFLASHVVHHLALVILLAEAQGVAVSREHGVAFSTAAYRDSGGKGASA